MLAEHTQQLISAALDRELTTDEAREVRELLRTSAEARAFYELLKADRDRLRGLLPVPAPADLPRRIMARVSRVDPRATPAPSRPAKLPRRALPAWVPVAVAASVLIAMTGGSILYFSWPGNSTGDNPLADAGNGNSAPGKPQSPSGWDGILPREQAVLPPAVPHVVDPQHEAVVRAPEPKADSEINSAIPPPRAIEPRPRDALAFPPMTAVAPFDLVEVRIPFLASVSDLDRDDMRKSVLDELSRESAFRIDLFASDLGRGVDLVRAVARAQGLTLFTDARVAEGLKHKVGTAYLIYTESLTPTEIRNLLSRLAAANQKPDGVFDRLHLSPATAADARELKEVLGLDPGLWKRPQPAGKGAARLDPEKPISSGTAEEVAGKLAPPPSKSGQKPAILLTFAPHAARMLPAASGELKKYLAGRGERRPDAMPVMIVIR